MAAALPVLDAVDRQRAALLAGTYDSSPLNGRYYVNVAVAVAPREWEGTL